jgi:hypothetical protein
MNKPQLLNLLIGKSIAETILVGAIAVVAFLNAFPPTFHGWGEAVVERRSIAGWAVNNAKPTQPVEVQIFIDGKFKGVQPANLSRPDIVAAGWARDAGHGYEFFLTQLPPGNHEARVYAVHPSGGGERYTLQLLGDPIKFTVHTDDLWRTR